MVINVALLDDVAVVINVALLDVIEETELLECFLPETDDVVLTLAGGVWLVVRRLSGGWSRRSRTRYFLYIICLHSAMLKQVWHYTL